jgi:hypothetical protein
MTSCPWAGWEPASVSFCEARVCGWVAEPSNAWSSLAYVVLGLWLAQHRASRGNWLLASVAWANVAIGVGSFAFHGTGTFAGELVDLSGMFLLSGLLLSRALGRAQVLKTSSLGLAWAAFVLLPMAVVLVVKPAGIPLFALELIAGVVLEVLAWRRGRSPWFARFAQSLGLVSLAFAIWVTDTARLLCAPDNHLVTGHAVWHCLNAIAITRLFFFYLPSSLPVPQTQPA